MGEGSDSRESERKYSEKKLFAVGKRRSVRGAVWIKATDNAWDENTMLDKMLSSFQTRFETLAVVIHNSFIKNEKLVKTNERIDQLVSGKGTMKELLEEPRI